MGKHAKSVIGICALAVFIIAAAFGAVQLYRYQHPHIEIAYGESEDGATTMPRLLISGESIWGYSDTVKEHIATYIEQEGAMERYLLTTYRTPRELSTRVEIKDGKTVLTFTGQGTLEDGTISEINEQLVFDFILTTNIPES